MLTIFYDSTCPLCAKEMRALRALDESQALGLVDLHSSEFRENYPYINFDEAMRILHAEMDGEVLTGLDVTVAAWQAVGKKPWLKVLRWPVVRRVADWAYVLFADNRYRISWLLTGSARCTNDVCERKPGA